MLKLALILSFLVANAELRWLDRFIQPRPYSQCGGADWTGSTTCPQGFYCFYQNQWYSQCLPGEGPSTTAPTGSTVSTTRAPNTGSACLDFTKGSFKVGISYDRRSEINIADYDFVTIWMNTIDAAGSTAWNEWYQGEMLGYCKTFRKIPLFYAYVIAFEARAMLGYQDCDVHPTNNLCHKGSQFIRDHRSRILSKYSEHALNIAYTYGTTEPVIFVIEPDFWQYYGDATQEGGPLSGEYMRALFDDIVNVIKSFLPKAMISWDISAWIGEAGFTKWWSYFATADIDFIHTSGGQARGDLPSIKPGELAWNFVSATSGKKILADCGYGVAGGDSSNCDVWSNTANQNARINDGVISLSVAKPNGRVSRLGVTC